MKNLTFNSKETYLAYRSAWKASYKLLGTQIRTLRLGDRFHQRKEFARLALTEAEAGILVAARTICAPSAFDCQRRTRAALATDMLAELKAAKQEAQRQYLARKAATL